MQLKKQESTTCPNTNRVRGVELPNQGGYYEATSDPLLWAATWTLATLSEWKSKRSQKLSKKMSKCANFTITAAKSHCTKQSPLPQISSSFSSIKNGMASKKTQD